MMPHVEIRTPTFLLFLSLATNLCFGQSFDQTNLSSDKPLYGTPPYTFDNCEIYFVAFKTDPEIVRALVPEPLIPISDGTITIVFSKLKIVKPVSIDYLECLISVPVALKNTTGDYHPVLYLSEFEGIPPGREIYGYNKILAEVEIEEKENVVNVSVKERREVIINASINLGESMPIPEDNSLPRSFFHKYIPSIEKGANPAVNQITSTELMNIKTTEFRPGKATLELLSTKYDPLDQIPVLEIIMAGYFERSFVLDYGRIVHDFLRK